MTEPQLVPSLVAPLVAFSERMHRALGQGHHVASPLGAWMLLAVGATATQGQEREACALALGMDVDAAAAFAARLLRAPHPAVPSAAALWTREMFDTPALRAWRARQPESMVRGVMPSQAEADEWARHATTGLIEKFPGTIGPLTAVVLATALAAKSTWTESYEVIRGASLARPGRASELNRSGARMWAQRIRWALRSPEVSDQRIVRSSLAGDLAVHRVRTRSGLSVTSVIARPDVPAGDVLAAAFQITTGVAGSHRLQAVSLFDLPLGHHELWSIDERRVAAPGRHEMFQSYLAAWEARSDHDLLVLPLEIGTAADAIAAMLKTRPLPPQARQVAMARYTRTGFEAAAISTLSLSTLAMLVEVEPQGIMRRATLRFGHPFAVVAVVDEPEDPLPGSRTDTRDSPWQGLPVFSAWVAEPCDVELSEEEQQWRGGDEDPDAAFGDEGIFESGTTPSPGPWWRRFGRFLRRER